MMPALSTAVRRPVTALAVALVLAAVLAGPLAAQEPLGDAQSPAPPEAAFVLREWDALNDPKVQRREPFRIFDNLYYVGIGWVSAYLVTTSDGLIVIDSLYGDFAGDVVEGVRRPGFDPKRIRYVLVTHGHFDHAGAHRLHLRGRGPQLQRAGTHGDVPGQRAARDGDAGPRGQRAEPSGRQGLRAGSAPPGAQAGGAPSLRRARGPADLAEAARGGGREKAGPGEG